MKNALFDELISVLSSPIYVFKPTVGGHFCDKLVVHEDKKIKRTRYMITAEIQCTCLGWMKFSKCKHLSMLKGNFDWLEGASAETVVEESYKIYEVLAKKFSESLGDWELKTDDLPDVVRSVEFSLKEFPKELSLVCSIRQVLKGCNFVVLLKGA